MISWKNDKGFSVIELSLIIVAIAIITFTGLYIHDRRSGTKTTPGTATPSSLIAEVDKIIEKKYSSLSTYTTDWIAQMGVDAAIPVAGYPFSLSSQNFPSTQIEQKINDQPISPPVSTTIKTARQAIDEVMSTHGFSTSAGAYSVDPTKDPMTGMSIKALEELYSLGDTSCLEIYYPTTTPITLSCFTKNDIAKMAARANPYVDTYRTANPGIIGTISFGPVTVKSQHKSGVLGPSNLAGYDISEAVFSFAGAKNIALYYNSQNGPWMYITKANDEYGFTCGSYMSSPVIRKMMYNQICLSEKGQIRLDTNNRALQ